MLHGLTVQKHPVTLLRQAAVRGNHLPEDCKVVKSLELVHMAPLLRKNHCQERRVHFILLHVDHIRRLQQALRCDLPTGITLAYDRSLPRNAGSFWESL